MQTTERPHVCTPEIEEDILENGEIERTWTCSDPDCGKLLKVTTSYGAHWAPSD